MRLTIAYSKIKKRNLVLINNDTYQRETLSERPIRQPLRQIYCKNWFSDRVLPIVFYITIANADIGSPKCFHALFDKYLDHSEIWTKLYGKLYGPSYPNSKHFDKNG